MSCSEQSPLLYHFTTLLSPSRQDAMQVYLVLVVWGAPVERPTVACLVEGYGCLDEVRIPVIF